MGNRTREKRRARPGKRGPETKAKLLIAAMEEFRLNGYEGTDTNKIARKAGFAPQTFYRWFKNKTDAFIAVYRVWEEQEFSLLLPMAAKGATEKVLAKAIIQHHRNHRLFRRSLRQLSVEDAMVRRARAKSRRRQVDHIKSIWRLADNKTHSLLLALLQAERIADAVAERELHDLKVPESCAHDELAQVLRRIRRGNA